MLIDSFLSRVPFLYRALFVGARWRIPAITGQSVYLTFDDGPIPEVTPWVLDELDRWGIKATFFCVADNVRKHPEIFADILRRGHQVGNHTYHHLKGLWTRTETYVQDVHQAHELIQSRYFRPPYGHMRMRQLLRLSGSFEIVMWDVLTRDYSPRLSPQQVLENVQRYSRNGSIIVFHDSLRAEHNLRWALPRAIEWLLAEGYHFLRMGDTP